MTIRLPAALLFGGFLCVAAAQEPAAPDYSRPDTWAAWPGRPSGADARPPGIGNAPLSPDVQADVFFIHPTTYLKGDENNARFDEPGSPMTQIDSGVLRFQASAFNGCCRIYAPRYRQASIGTFSHPADAASQAAYQLAYSDVLRAFDYYIAHENQGRPFIIASHSQGSLHAARLLQERIAGKALLKQMVAAYVVGFYVPQDIERAGIPECRAAEQTGCVIVWNTVKEGASDRKRQESRFAWIDGRYQMLGTRKLVCVNPLNWSADGEASADLNMGALPGVRGGAELRAVVPGLTGARCDGASLYISIPLAERSGFVDPLTMLGSYHIFDYNIFYTNIRINAEQRVLAWRAAASRGH
jgi:hypothetical protein